MGLTRAFHLAVARNVVASLWKVDDEATAALMRLFYYNVWVERKTAAQALRGATHHLPLPRGDQRLSPATRGPKDLAASTSCPRAPGNRRRVRRPQSNSGPRSFCQVRDESQIARTELSEVDRSHDCSKFTPVLFSGN